MVMVCVHVRVCVVRGSLDPQLPNYKCYSHWNLLTKGDMGSPSPVRFETKKEKKETSGGESTGEIASQISDFTCDL